VYGRCHTPLLRHLQIIYLRPIFLFFLLVHVLLSLHVAILTACYHVNVLIACSLLSLSCFFLLFAILSVLDSIAFSAYLSSLYSHFLMFFFSISILFCLSFPCIYPFCKCLSKFLSASLFCMHGIFCPFSVRNVLPRPAYSIVVLSWSKFICDKSGSGMLKKSANRLYIYTPKVE
jgi:hypothetical protein